MNGTQTVHELLDSFNLDLDLPSECLSLEIEGDFDSYEIIQRTLSFIKFGLNVLGSNIQNGIQ